MEEKFIDVEVIEEEKNETSGIIPDIAKFLEDVSKPLKRFEKTRNIGESAEHISTTLNKNAKKIRDTMNDAITIKDNASSFVSKIEDSSIFNKIVKPGKPRTIKRQFK